MKVIINATNLLGDSIYSLQPLHDYIDGTPPGSVVLVTDRGLVNQMFHDTFQAIAIFDNVDDAIRFVENVYPSEDMKIIRLDAGTSGHICFTSARDKGKQLHISEGFAEMLGIKLCEPVLPYAPWNNWEPKTAPPPVTIGIAPFSRSCSRHSGEPANKTLDDYKWMTIISFFRMHSDKLVILGGPTDRLKGIAVSEDEYFCAKSFEDLRKKLKSLTMLVTVDNGIGHLASVLDVDTVILWPKVSSKEFIAPMWAPHTYYIEPIDPPTIQAAVLLSGIRKFTKHVLDKEL